MKLNIYLIGIIKGRSEKESMEKFSERVKQLRKGYGWSQETLAQKIGTEPIKIAGYESMDHHNMPDIEILITSVD
ncbi:helix-turn-helix domain-containing protein [Paenibacillus terrae]|uniref:helix-turn-helix domain-containing protein n=1 Tax=Paenibacillus terrae TaxID=159743 RepID=UPI00126A553F|nr:helix-turn-helix domain-containing protein [Paenibacillus terrae]